jgi:hypothetical protein
VIIFFLIVYSNIDIVKSNGEKVEDFVDTLYFTTTTHSTVGYGDMGPKNKTARMWIILHHFIVIFIASGLFFFNMNAITNLVGNMVK